MNNPNINPDSKLPDVGLSIFAVMSQKASAANALNMAQGFPDFSPPQALQDSLKAHIDQGHHQYAPMSGLPRLQQKIAVKTKHCYGVDVDPVSEITLTAGATEALFAAITCIIRPGDEVVIFDPAYDSYAPVIRLSGGQPVHLAMRPPDYKPDWNTLRAALTPRTRLIIFNTPHNPCGSLLNRQDFAALEAIIAGRDIYLISDEVYEHIVFGNQQHLSMLQFPDLRQRAFVISSFGKTYHATGWKMGYCIAPPALTQQLRIIHQFVTFCVSTPVQHAIADQLDQHQHYDDLPLFYEQKRDHFRQAVTASRFKVLPCDGSYFQLLDYSAISDAPDTEYADQLIAEHGIAAIPISVFYADGTDHKVLRFCFAKDNDTLDRAGEILCAI